MGKNEKHAGPNANHTGPQQAGDDNGALKVNWS